MYVNAVSPGVKGKKKTLDGIVKNKKQAVSSVRDITLNKDQIEFRDIETNELVKGELPTNLWEFGSSVSTRKSQVYQQVINLVEGTDGVTDTARIIEEMDKIIKDPVYNRMPEIQNKAKQVRDVYANNQYNASDIERLIQIENDGLQAFYRGGGTQADSVVNAIVANNLRDILDETVEQAQGEGVKALKAQYGALKSIETDVVHRALHNSQARDAGLVDMFGIRTIGDLSRGAMGDVGALRQGAGQILGEGFIKALNDRDAMIHRMFMVAEQTYKKGDTSFKSGAVPQTATLGAEKFATFEDFVDEIYNFDIRPDAKQVVDDSNLSFRGVPDIDTIKSGGFREVDLSEVDEKGLSSHDVSVYFSEDPSVAIEYGIMGRGPTRFSGSPENKGVLSMDLSSLNIKTIDDNGLNMNAVKDGRFFEQAREEGFDGISSPGNKEVAVWNTKKLNLLDRESLRDMYNRSHNK